MAPALSKIKTTEAMWVLHLAPVKDRLKRVLDQKRFARFALDLIDR